MIWFWIGSHAEYDHLLRQLFAKKIHIYGGSRWFYRVGGITAESVASPSPNQGVQPT